MTRHQPPPSESDTNATPLRGAWQAAHVGEAERALLRRDSAAFLHQSVSTPCLTAIAKAEGIWLEDLSGRRFMDFHGNSAHTVGYGHPRVKQAIAEQLEKLSFSPRRFTCERSVELAETLGRITPGTLSKVLFTTGGSDAVEVAIKLARAATGRFKTLSFWDAFHGAGFGASAVGGEALFRAGPHGPMMPGTEHVAPFACYRCPYGWPERDGKPLLDQCRLSCASMVRYVLEREGDVAAVIAEPMRATPVPPPPGYWQAVRDACDATGTLLIFDEIPTGLGRTGRMFSCEHDGVVPDILVIGKGLGGGVLPIAAVVARPELDVGADWAFGHYTHEKNPVTAAAALATIAVIEDEGLVDRAARLGAIALDRLEALKARCPAVGDVRGRGLMIGVELVEDRAAKRPAKALAERTLYEALARGLSFKTTFGNTLTLAPPLVITEPELMQALDILEDALGAALAA
ncbi:aspartate aminotransferase family protein [Alsobacter soli]|uniref:Aspartate aminotransferase family protein n=1 Tax=Alsobacter soli TaxID=2109933 RepID=A0A2T1HPP6_9HYPH|nr:aspartate aminotransferase family protein [Alsobacter soli]PSC03620.1 aspartate aminotransferase family protein [Alsobacter soli]